MLQPLLLFLYQTQHKQYPSIANGTLVNRWKAQAHCGGRQTLGQTQYNTLQTAISNNSEGNFQLYDCIIQKYNYHGEAEVRFFHAVTARNNAIYNIDESTKYILS